MATVLGIDTGGTYTDGIIIDVDTKEILAATKANTTHHDLMIGIRNCINQLDIDTIAQIDYISLSTTLATNAIVEGRGSRVGLLLLGMEPVQALPNCEYAVLPGGCNIRGDITEALDLAATKAAVVALKDKVDAMAVSGYLSVRNPEQELTVKELIREMTGLPVVAAHELTTVLGYQERTVTAVLNARLIAIIDDLLLSVKTVLKEKGIEAPIMIVKGDGSLMNEAIAKEKPIETILSGPAASIMGATFLEDITDGLVVDVGGTTTDIAVLKNGLPRLDVEGARVGGWLTRVTAAEVNTFGLGGDSKISYQSLPAELKVGPRRAWPISYITKQYPHYCREVEDYIHFPRGLLHVEPADGLFLLRRPDAHLELTQRERDVLAVLESGPHTYIEIASQLDMETNFIRVDRLINEGYLGMVGLTPTDLLHVKGSYTPWDKKGAYIGAAAIALKAGMDVDEFVALAEKRVVEELCRTIVDSALHYENGRGKLGKSPEMQYFWDKAVNEGKGDLLSFTLRLETPIIGIGAPVAAWLPQVAEKLGCPLVLPCHSEVANAVGAAVGKVMNICRILIEPVEGRLNVYAPWGRKTYAELEIAVAEASIQAKEVMKEKMSNDSIGQYEILSDRKDTYVSPGYDSKEKLLLKSVLEFVAVGRPDWR